MNNSILPCGKHYIYRHVRLDNNQPFYVGVGTKSKKDVLYMTYNRSKTTHRNNRYWKNITNSIQYEVDIMIESDDYEFIKQKEIEFIKLYGRADRGEGYLVNMTDGGEGTVGRIVSESTRKIWSEQRKGEKNQNYGKTPSAEWRKKMSEIMSGENGPNYGKRASEETRRKMSDTRKGKILPEQVEELANSRKRNNPKKGRRVINSTTGIIYNSVSEASKDYMYSRGPLRVRLEGIVPNDTPFTYYKEEDI